ncbi:ATP-binding protein [Pseudochelatococcus sp. G4_1912]|uniref:ATP-binding protein n=1 Tax=Pseudochelatococcus sp. G4_1912 TaxID=3114288 RepID=UPI0039C758B8
MKLTLRASLDALPMLLDSADSALHGYGIDDESCATILLSIDEVFSNIILHGQLDASSDVIQFTLSPDKDGVSIDICDPGPPFDAAKAAHSAAASNGPISDIPIGGWGLLLVQAFTANIQYVRENSTNHIRLSFKLPLATDGVKSSV